MQDMELADQIAYTKLQNMKNAENEYAGRKDTRSNGEADSHTVY